MTVILTATTTRDLQETSRREWLETNGLGGWAGSTVSGAHTRRYHGLLVAATRPPVGRMVLLSRLEETLVCDGQRYELSCNFYPGAVHPTGYRYLEGFEKDFFPRFSFEVGGVRLRKTVAAIHGENSTLVFYEVMQSPAPIILELRPFVAARGYHDLSRANDFIRREGHFQDGVFRVRPYNGVPEILISVPGAKFTGAADWYFNFEYPMERQRGLDHREDLFTHGTFRLSLEAGQAVGIIVSTENPAGRNAFALLKQEEQRRRDLLSFLPGEDDFPARLALAADQFLVRRSESLSTIMAGYHWFTDWGRDTMIALPGITLATGRYEEAGKILLAFSRHLSQGMLPNRFPNAGLEPEYNTMDATLWFFVAGYHYFLHTGDRKFVRDRLLPAMEDILAWHRKGTRYGIRVDSDGLLTGGKPGVQLTWMDAKVDGWVVTSRQGKAVEINALWYNALKIFAYLLHECNRFRELERYNKEAETTKKSFNRLFWEEEGGSLHDYIDGEYKDNAVRPNQVFAISLPYPLLSKKKAAKVLAVLEEKLLTPVGLRTLDPEHPDYRPRYCGDPVSRDGSYHQGTVWPWLLGPFITALLRFQGETGKEKAQKILEGMAGHLNEAGLGTISEIFDAEPPHTPRGCIAQAWSVAELLRVFMDMENL
ncbi:MAG: amylo-alpha-1,6-glucosidase [Desulfurivibrionaceae bacterium]